MDPKIVGKIRVMKKSAVSLQKAIDKFSNLDKKYQESESYLQTTIRALEKDFETYTAIDREIIAKGVDENEDYEDYVTGEYYDVYKLLYFHHMMTLGEALKRVTTSDIHNSTRSN